MFLIQLIVLLLFIFIGLIFFMRYILTRNISRATGHLQELSRDYAVKQEEANKRLQQVKEEAEKILSDARQQAEQFKEKTLHTIEEMKIKILEEARHRGREITEKAQKNYEFLKNEVEQKVDVRGREIACRLVQDALTEDMRASLHQIMMRESADGEFQMKRLNLPEDVREAKVISAFPLTAAQRADLQERLKKQLSADVSLAEEADASLLAGFLIQIGPIVIDASLKNKILQTIPNVQQPAV